MEDTFHNRVAALLLSRKNRARYIAVLTCTALAVTFGVVAGLMRSGQAKTHEVRVLECQEVAASNIAHHHTADCYDAEGNLVCPLEEREAHKHDDSCYETQRVLICGQEESDTHHHTDACYKEEKVLVCGKEETTEEHVHGAECFKTVTVSDDEAEANEDANKVPAQSFKEDLKETDENDQEHVVLTVAAEAPEGALPLNATMKVEAVENEKAEDVKNAVDAAIKERLGEDAAIDQKTSVKVTFVDNSGNEVTPSKKVSYKITNAAVKDTAKESLTLAHVDGKTNKADLIADTAKVNADEKDTTTGNEDTISFKADAADTFVISDAKGGAIYAAQIAGMPAQSFEGEDGNIKVKVEAPEGAFAEGTTMKVTAVKSDEVAQEIQSAVKDQADVVKVNKYVAADITFYDVDGNEVQPMVPVSVSMTSDEVRDIKSPVIVHVPDDATGEVVSNTDTSAEDSVSFDASQFSKYVIADLQTLDAGIITDEGEAYKISVSYGADAQIPSDATLQVKELSASSKDFQEFSEAAQKAVKIEDSSLNYTRLFDISILDAAGQKVEPAKGAQVDVKIELADAASDDLNIVHFPTDDAKKAEVIKEAETSAADEGKMVQFSTTGFSTYAVVSAGNTKNLDGRSFAILSTVNQSGTNVYPTYRAMTAQDGQADDGATGFASVKAQYTANLADVDGDAVVWTFHRNQNGGDNAYFLESNGRYLNIDNGVAGYSNNPVSIQVIAGTGDKADKVRLVGNNGQALNIYGGNRIFGPYGDNAGDPNEWMKLFDMSKTDEKLSFLARPVSASPTDTELGLQDGHSYIVYQYFYNPKDKEVQYYAIDGNGNLCRCYRKGDELLAWTSESPFWEFRADTTDGQTPTPQNFAGTFHFKSVNYTNPDNKMNPQNKTMYGSGKYMAPGPDNTFLSDTNTALTMASMYTNRTYMSEIEAFDSASGNYFGYQLVWDDQTETVTLGTGSDYYSDYWLFAEASSAGDTKKAHEVPTHDSAKDGVHITMYDFIGAADGGDGRGKMNELIGGGDYDDTDYGDGAGKGNNYNNSGKTQMVLGDDGWPKTQDGKSFSKLFEDGSLARKWDNCNNLFLQETYEALGFYEYNAFENYAQFDTNSRKFTVYRELGTPQESDDPNTYFYQRGNFYPFDKIVKDNDGNLYDEAQKSKNNYYGNGLKITDVNPYDPTAGGPLTKINNGNGVNYHFGMTVDFGFLMPKDGKQRYSDMLFQFNGDDDMYVFVDGVKLLDIGGIHDALPGMINFATGEISYGDNIRIKRFWDKVPLTIKQAFKLAGKLPNGDAWDDNRVDEFFRDETFKDYTTHTFKMFYAEHGEAASNLDIRFNLPALEPQTVKVRKEIPNDVNKKLSPEDRIPGKDVDPRYTDRLFYYKLWVTDSDGNEYQVKSKDANVTDAKVVWLDASGSAYNEKELTWNTDGTFSLHADQEASFKLNTEDLKWRVEEVNIEDDISDVTIEPASARSDVYKKDQHPDYYSTIVLDSGQSQVVFGNEMEPRPLEVSKLLTYPEHDQSPDDSFGFRLWTDTFTTSGIEGMQPAVRLAYQIYETPATGADHNVVWNVVENGKLYNVRPDGRFYLKANQKAVFPFLIGGTHFMVIEDNTTEYYYFDQFKVNNNLTRFFNTSNEWAEFSNNGANNFWDLITKGGFDNDSYHVLGKTKIDVDKTDLYKGAARVDTYNADGARMKIVKLDNSKSPWSKTILNPDAPSNPDVLPPTSAQIAGAHFRLTLGQTVYKHYWDNDHDGIPELCVPEDEHMRHQNTPNDDDDANGYTPEEDHIEFDTAHAEFPDVTIGQQGLTLDPNTMQTGTWKIEEIQAPNGYIVVNQFQPVYVKYVAMKDWDATTTAPVQLVDENGKPVTDNRYNGVVSAANILVTDGNHYELQLFIYNTPGAELPHAGGPGTTFFTITGTAMCVAAAVAYGISSRRRQEGRF